MRRAALVLGALLLALGLTVVFVAEDPVLRVRALLVAGRPCDAMQLALQIRVSGPLLAPSQYVEVEKIHGEALAQVLQGDELARCKLGWLSHGFVGRQLAVHGMEFNPKEARECLPALRDLLVSDSPDAQMFAAEALLAMLQPGDHAQLLPVALDLLEHLEPSAENQGVLSRTIMLLGAMGESAGEAVPALVRIVRWKAPGQTEEERLVWRLVGLDAIWALGRIGPRASGALQALQEVDVAGDPALTYARVLASERISSPPDAMHRMWQEMRTSPQLGVELVRYHGTPGSEVLPVLLERLVRLTGRSERCSVIENLGRLGVLTPEVEVRLEQIRDLDPAGPDSYLAAQALMRLTCHEP